MTEVVVRDRPIARSSGVDQALRGWMAGPIPRRQLGQRASATGAGEPRPSQGISSPLLDTEGGLSPDFVWTASRVASHGWHEVCLHDTLVDRDSRWVNMGLLVALAPLGAGDVSSHLRHSLLVSS